jgi:glutamate/tyrosine decarboxylase-like PLP-dependent enzyme
MLGAPLQSSVFITRRERALHETNSAAARYLFQQDKFYDVSYGELFNRISAQSVAFQSLIDTGDKSVQCGRKVDAFKLWFMFKARGENFFEKVVDNAFQQAEYLNHLIRTYPGLSACDEIALKAIFPPISVVIRLQTGIRLLR